MTTQLDSWRLTQGVTSFAPKAFVFDCVESTNDTAWKLYYEHGENEGIIVFADAQSGGKGRFSRKWHSPAGENVYCSVVLKPQIKISQIHLVTALGTLAALDAINEYSPEKAVIIFPNDIYAGGMKTAGILTETKLISDKPEAFVIGAGINVNTLEFPDDLKAIATSLAILNKGRPLDRAAVAHSLISRIDHYYGCLEGDITEIYRKWREGNFLIGRRITIYAGARSKISGILEDTDPADGISLRANSGTLIRYRFESIEKVEFER